MGRYASPKGGGRRGCSARVRLERPEVVALAPRGGEEAAAGEARQKWSSPLGVGSHSKTKISALCLADCVDVIQGHKKKTL